MIDFISWLFGVTVGMEIMLVLMLIRKELVFKLISDSIKKRKAKRK